MSAPNPAPSANTVASPRAHVVAVAELIGAAAAWTRHEEAMRTASARFGHIVDDLLDEFNGARLNSRDAELVACFEEVDHAMGWASALRDAANALDWPTDDEADSQRHGVGVAVGISAGVIQTCRDGLSGRQLVRGEAIDRAARLARGQTDGGIVLGARAVDLVDHAAVELHDVGAGAARLGPATRSKGARSEQRTNLRTFDTDFVGRTREFNALAEALDAARSACVVGPAGAGKTRLSVEFAHAWLAARADADAQAWFVDLAGVAALDEALFRVARTAGIQLPTSEATADVEARLTTAFKSRGAALVILDDVGQLDHVAAWVARWLANCAELRVIQTRQSIPETDAHLVHVDALGRASACALLETLVHRPIPCLDAWAAGEPLDALVERCGRLPLAIELAAGNSAHAPDWQRGDPATESAATAAPGQLQQTLLRSWDVLADAERRALQVCTVFAESFTTEAALSIIAASADADAQALFSTLRRLSLVRSTARPDQPQRHMLLAPVRDFVRERTPTDVLEAAKRAHLEYYAGWCRELRHALQGPDERAALDRAREELANLYTAADIGWRADAACWLDVLECLGELDKRIGPLGGFGARPDACVERLRAQDTPALLLRALRLRAQATMWTGRYEAAERDSREALALAEQLGDVRRATYALSDLGFALGVQGKQQEGLPTVRQAVERIDDDDAYEAIAVLTNAAVVARNCREIDEATGYLHRALLRARRSQSAFAEASVLFLLSTILRHNQQWSEAARNLNEAQSLFISCGERRGRLLCYHELGECYTATGQFERAETCYREAMELATNIGDREHSAVFWLGRGHSRFARADFATAESDLLEATLAIEEIGHVHLKIAALLFLAATYGALERVTEARAYFERVEAIFNETGIDREKPLYEVLFGYLDAAWARAAMRKGDEAAARRHLGDAYARVEAATQAPLPSAQREVEPLRAYLDAHVESGDLPAGGAPHRSVLRVCEDLRWFAVDDTEPVDISRRGPIRRILRALIEQRLAHPGEPMSADALLAAGWPDEVLTHQSATQRLHTTMSRMRSLGLQDVVDTIDGAYLIAPMYAPVWVARNAPRD